MTNPEYLKEIDSLAVGLTRSPLFMGVPIRLFFANVMICTLICIDAQTFLGIPLFFVMYVVMLKLSVKDTDFFQIWVKSLMKTPPVFNSRFWGGTNSYEPW